MAGSALVLLGVAFELLSERSEEMKQELLDWEQGRTLALGVLPHGPSMAVRKEGRRLRYLGRGDHGAALKILFKNVDSALLVLLGLLPSHIAFAERRAIVHGPLYKVMEANRAMSLVVKFLFPGIMLKTLTKRMPEFSSADLLLKAQMYATIMPAVVKSFSK